MASTRMSTLRTAVAFCGLFAFGVSSVMAGPITTNRMLWFQADAITGLNDNDPISSWTDSHAAVVASSTTTLRPSYQSDISSQLNGLPVVRFDGVDDRLTTTTVAPGSDQATVFVVGKVTATTSFGELVTYGINSAGSWNFRQESSTGRLSLVNGATNSGAGATSAFTPAGTTTNLVGQGFKILAGSFTAADVWRIWENGDLKHTNTVAFTQAASNTVVLGNRGDAITSLNGDIAEVIVYSRALIAAERLIEENYLAAKWDRTILVDRYAGDTNTNGHYDSKVFGIAREADGAVTSGTFNTGLAIADLNSSLGSGESVMAGHKLSTNGFVPEGTGAATSRWDRVWFVDARPSNSIDTTLTFDFSEGGVTMPVLGPNESYVLLHSLADPFLFSVVNELGNVSGDTVAFNVLNLETGYYTLGILTAAPEPSTSLLLMLGGVGLVARRRSGRERSARARWSGTH